MQLSREWHNATWEDTGYFIGLRRRDDYRRAGVYHLESLETSRAPHVIAVLHCIAIYTNRQLQYRTVYHRLHSSRALGATLARYIALSANRLLIIINHYRDIGPNYVYWCLFLYTHPSHIYVCICVPICRTIGPREPDF